MYATCGSCNLTLPSVIFQYTSQLSDQSLLNESLGVTQGRVSDLTSQLEAAARQLNEVTGSAARTETQLRQKVRPHRDSAPSEGETAQRLSCVRR